MCLSLKFIFQVKERLQRQKQKIHEENLRLQEQLSNAWKIHEKLKQQAAITFNNKVVQSITLSKMNSSAAQPSQFLQVPQEHPTTSMSIGIIPPQSHTSTG